MDIEATVYKCLTANNVFKKLIIIVTIFKNVYLRIKCMHVTDTFV